MTKKKKVSLRASLQAIDIIKVYRRMCVGSDVESPAGKVLRHFNEHHRTPTIMSAYDPSGHDGLDGELAHGLWKIDERLKRVFSTDIKKLLTRLEKKHRTAR